MSLKRQIARNIARNDNVYLAQFQNSLDPNWRNLPQAQKSLIANLSRNGITPADLEKAKQDGRREAYEDTAPAVLLVAYAAMGVILHDSFGLERDDVLKALKEVDHKIVMTLDNEELTQELEDKCGIRVYSKEGVGRIESVR